MVLVEVVRWLDVVAPVKTGPTYVLHLFRDPQYGARIFVPPVRCIHFTQLAHEHAMLIIAATHSDGVGPSSRALLEDLLFSFPACRFSSGPGPTVGLSKPPSHSLCESIPRPIVFRRLWHGSREAWVLTLDVT